MEIKEHRGKIISISATLATAGVVIGIWSGLNLPTPVFSHTLNEKLGVHVEVGQRFAVDREYELKRELWDIKERLQKAKGELREELLRHKEKIERELEQIRKLKEKLG